MRRERRRAACGANLSVYAGEGSERVTVAEVSVDARLLRPSRALAEQLIPVVREALSQLQTAYGVKIGGPVPNCPDCRAPMTPVAFAVGDRVVVLSGTHSCWVGTVEGISVTDGVPTYGVRFGDGRRLGYNAEELILESSLPKSTAPSPSAARSATRS